MSPVTVWDVGQWFQVLGFGAVGGAMGQGIRTVVGLKKVNDSATATPGNSFTDLIQPSRLVVSLVIGAIAGALAATTVLTDLSKIPLATFLALAAAGYSGADFIEGFMNREMPKPDAGVATQPPASASVTTADGAAG